MNKHYEKYLLEKYPLLFSDRENTCMKYGFSCGDGWFWLINHLCDYLQTYIDHENECFKKGYRETKVEQIIAFQVKEKFGGLRFYVNHVDEHISGVIAFASHLSYFICEKTGRTDIDDVGLLNRDGFVQNVSKSFFDPKAKKTKWTSLYNPQLLKVVRVAKSKFDNGPVNINDGDPKQYEFKF